jgi:hypothetical protein
VDSELTSLIQGNVEIAKNSWATPKESGGEIDSNVGASEQASSVDLELTSLVQGNVEIAKNSSANHLSMAAYIKKYPNLFVPEFFGEVDAQCKQGTTKNSEDDSAGTLDSNMVENESVSESVEELNAIHKTAKSLLGGGTSCSGALSKSQKRNRKRRQRKKMRHQNRHRNLGGKFEG